MFVIMQSSITGMMEVSVLPPSSYILRRYKDARSVSSLFPSDSQTHFYKPDKHPLVPRYRKSSPHQAVISGSHPQPIAAASEIQIVVKDTGVGIPKEDQDRVYERFYRVDKSHSKEIGGTGLGLSIVKHAVGALKGSVILRSEEGNGTEITLRFPKVHME